MSVIETFSPQKTCLIVFNTLLSLFPSLSFRPPHSIVLSSFSAGSPHISSLQPRSSISLLDQESPCLTTQSFPQVPPLFLSLFLFHVYQRPSLYESSVSGTPSPAQCGPDDGRCRHDGPRSSSFVVPFPIVEGINCGYIFTSSLIRFLFFFLRVVGGCFFFLDLLLLV